MVLPPRALLVDIIRCCARQHWGVFLSSSGLEPTSGIQTLQYDSTSPTMVVYEQFWFIFAADFAFISS
jgi:hypothetical protein